MSYGAIRAIREAGLKIPDDLSVVGFDIHNLTDDRQQMITTVCQPEENIGRQVAQLLLERFKSEETHQTGVRLRLDPFLYEGDTVKII